MTDWRKHSYAAVITIDLPGFEPPLRASVTLLPPDQVATFEPNGGQVVVKALQDCTLADLRRFADALEKEAAGWDIFDEERLGDFVRRQEAEVEIRVSVGPDGSGTVDKESWWAQAAVVWEVAVEPEEPEELPAASDQLLADGEEREKDNSALLPAESDPLPAEDDTPVEAEEGVLAELTADSQQLSAPSTAADLALRIIVAEPEPAFVEREAAEIEHVIRKRDTENRVAGYRLPLEDPTPAAVDVLIDERAFRDAQAHASSSLHREVAGMLIGPPPEKQPNGRYVVHITDTIIAEHTRMHGASVTYTPESWRYINDVLWERYPDEECIIVGWYHTHPGFGIFLSNMDLFIHHNFFIQKWHVALVLDPVARRSGFFTWNRAQSEVMAYHFPWPYWAHTSW